MVQSEEELFFKVDARHIIQLGRELVADPVTAVAELIKNAYDADATVVKVAFSDCIDAPGGSLIVQDDGTGMSLSEIQSAWMRISTPNKEGEQLSRRFKRLRSGKKGIGRFAVQSLGQHLRLRTTKRGSTDSYVIEFDWEGDYKPGLDLSSIANRMRHEKTTAAHHGTFLEITGLHECWDQKDLAATADAIVLLQPPFPVARVKKSPTEDPGFSVQLSLNDAALLVEISGKEEFLSSATAIIHGRLSPSGSAKVVVESKLFNLKETHLESLSGVLPGEIQFRAFYFVYKREALGGISTRVAQKMGNKFGGIRVYRDGLRVPPYGEGANDWLGLDAEYRKRSSALFPIANVNWFGFVSISRDSTPHLIDTASREGFVENVAFKQMKSFIRDSLQWGSTRVSAARQVKIRAGQKTEQKPESRLSIVDETEGEAKQLLQLAAKGQPKKANERFLKLFRNLRSSARSADTIEQKRQEQLLGEIGLLRVLASLGTSIVVFSHEVRGALNVATASLGDVTEAAEDATRKIKNSISQAVGVATDDMQRLQELSNYIDGFVSHGRRRKRKPLAVYDVVESFVGAFETTLSKRGVDIDWNVIPGSLRTAPMNRAEVESVLFNLLTNAIKAMEDDRCSERRILIAATSQNGQVVLRFEDTGRGIDPKIRGKIFDAFITSTFSSDHELGLGSGLGLKIVSDIAAANRGRVEIGKPSMGYRTCFEFTVPSNKAPQK